MCLVSKSNVAYSIGICPQFLDFVSKKRNLYQDHPSMLEGSFRSFQERGVIKNVNYEKFTLTLILKKDGKTTKEVEVEGVDRLQCLFLLENLEGMTVNGCQQPCCELPCCILKKLTAILQ